METAAFTISQKAPRTFVSLPPLSCMNISSRLMLPACRTPYGGSSAEAWEIASVRLSVTSSAHFPNMMNLAVSVSQSGTSSPFQARIQSAA